MVEFINRVLKRRYQIQKILLKIRGAKIGTGNTFNSWLIISGNPKNLSIGNFNVFNEYVLINSASTVEIGNNNHFSVGSKLLSTRLNDDLTTHESFPITIKDNNWFAVDSVIAVRNGPIYIGNDVIVGARTLVFRSIFERGKYFGIIS